ncbi:MAG: hypothetical protein K0V04_27510 [Deltaproteobacteria bacterium]|nr:hypothetical protein [Deltaproteobacteria bacterium]
MHRLLGPCSLALLTACSVFDESLYLEAEQDGGPDPAELFADACVNADIPVIAESTSLNLPLDAFNSVGLGYPKCVPDQYQGPDAFFILDAKRGERWNINAAPQTVDQDVAIVVLDDCSANSCRKVRDRCGAGFDEDFAIVATEDKRYIVSIDSLDPDTIGDITLSINKSECGNGVIEPGESCDGGSGCDEQCRRLIVDGTASEGEPNDIFTGVDMIGSPQAEAHVTITGSVGGPCDEDHYAFIVPEGASVSVQMNAPGGGPCPLDTPEIELPLMDFLAPGRPLRMGEGKTGGASGGCPSFDNLGIDPEFEFARNLPASEYHLIINARETPTSIPYEITFDIHMTTPPAP